MTDDGNRRGYDTLAEAYATRFLGELEQKPFDRALLRAFADLIRGLGRKVVDIGCGPGHVGAFLCAEGLDVDGLDGSAEMVRVARERFPAMKFRPCQLASLVWYSGTSVDSVQEDLDSVHFGSVRANSLRSFGTPGPPWTPSRKTWTPSTSVPSVPTRFARLVLRDLRGLRPGRPGLRPLRFIEADFRQLPYEDGSVSGVSAAYAIVHLTVPELPALFGELHRVLTPGGVALVSFHVGDEAIAIDELLGKTVSMTFRLLPVAGVRDALVDAGFEIIAALERQGDAAVEHPSLRAYLFARKPTAGQDATTKSRLATRCHCR